MFETVALGIAAIAVAGNTSICMCTGLYTDMYKCDIEMYTNTHINMHILKLAPSALRYGCC